MNLFLVYDTSISVAPNNCHFHYWYYWLAIKGMGSGESTYLHASKGPTRKDVSPNVSVIAGGGTSNKTWALAAMYYHSFKNDDIRYLGGLMYMNVNLDFYQLGKIDLSTFTNVDSLVNFYKISPTSNVVIARYDVWILPFLNIYGMGGYVDTKTSVEMTLPFLTDSPEIDFVSGSKGPLVGWGATIAAGVDSWFITGGYNYVWTFVPQLDDPAISQEADIRIGYTFDFKKKRPWSNISVMAGRSWLKLKSQSMGNANLTEIFGVGNNRPELLDKLNNWWDGLGPVAQKKLQPFYDTMEALFSGDNDAIVYYDFNKKLPQAWSMTLGMNYQVNHRLLINGIYTFLGSRNQFTAGVNYRFGFKGKNLFSGAIDRKHMHKIKQ